MDEAAVDEDKFRDWWEKTGRFIFNRSLKEGSSFENAVYAVSYNAYLAGLMEVDF